MSIVNLNKARKVRSIADDKAQADENAARFGQSKAARVLDAAKATQAKARLDQLKFDEE
jgi:hypothetical protein